MADSHASFWTRANALLRKSLTFQKRNIKQNVRLVSVPILLCLLLLIIQILVDNELDKPENRCGCVCIDTNGDGKCEKVCGLMYSTVDQAATCPIPHPPEWPPLLQTPSPSFRAVVSDVVPYKDLPSESCKRTGSCPVTILFTGNNHSLGEVVARNMFTSPFTLNSSDNLDSLASSVLGSESMPQYSNLLDPAFYSDLPMYSVQSKCSENPVFSVPINISSIEIQQEVRCVQGLHVWRNSSSEVNNELYKGYRYGNSERKINELLSAYDFSNSNRNNFNVSNAYLQFLLGYGTNILLEFVKEMPKPETSLRLDFSSLIGTLFYTWVILQLFPLKARYGGSYVFTMTTSSNHEQEVENLVRSLSSNANKIYRLSGTQKFELPKQEVNIADVFQAVENAKSKFTVFAWGLADTTLEDVSSRSHLGLKPPMSWHNLHNLVVAYLIYSLCQ